MYSTLILSLYDENNSSSNKKEQNTAEVNTKLQNVLEETLMKNIQLQNMVEVLQGELTDAKGGTENGSGMHTSSGRGMSSKTPPRSSKSSDDKATRM